MTLKTWVGGTATWDNAAAWSSQGMPVANDEVVIGANSSVTISPGVVQASVVGVDDPTANLIVNGVLQNTTVRLQGGQLTGTGILDNDAIIGTLTMMGKLQIADTVTVNAPSGQAALVLTAPGATVTGVGKSALNGGLAIVGSADPSRPVTFTGQGGPFALDVTLDVTGAAILQGFGVGPTASNATSSGPINIGPGGNLSLRGTTYSTGPIHLMGGTLDLTLSPFPPLSSVVNFDNATSTLVINNGEAVQIAGFRAGDTIDIKGLSYSGPVVQGGGVGGFTQVGGSLISIQGQQAAGATYQAASDGSGGTLLTTTAQPLASVAFSDQATGGSGSHALDAAAGGPSYLQWQYIDTSASTVAMTAGIPNVFLKGGGGADALTATSGQNVLDGGTGSSFLTGGSGTDTFFVDLRSGVPVWDTVVNFHAGDALTIWGWSPLDTETVDAQSGAAGYQGATLRFASGAGGPTDSVTLTGLSASQASHLQTVTGTSAGGVPYLYVLNPGV